MSASSNGQPEREGKIIPNQVIMIHLQNQNNIASQNTREGKHEHEQDKGNVSLSCMVKLSLFGLASLVNSKPTT